MKSELGSKDIIRVSETRRKKINTSRKRERALSFLTELAIQTAREEDSEKFAASLAQITPFLEKHNNLGLAKQVFLVMSE